MCVICDITTFTEFLTASFKGTVSENGLFAFPCELSILILSQYLYQHLDLLKNLKKQWKSAFLPHGTFKKCVLPIKITPGVRRWFTSRWVRVSLCLACEIWRQTATQQTPKSKYNQEQDIKMRCNHCKKKGNKSGFYGDTHNNRRKTPHGWQLGSLKQKVT